MKIQSTNIMQRDNTYLVEMLIAENPSPEPEDAQIHFIAGVQLEKPDQYPTLSKLQITTLDYVLDVLEQRRQAIVSASNRSL